MLDIMCSSARGGGQWRRASQALIAAATGPRAVPTRAVPASGPAPSCRGSGAGAPVQQRDGLGRQCGSRRGLLAAQPRIGGTRRCGSHRCGWSSSSGGHCRLRADGCCCSIAAGWPTACRVVVAIRLATHRTCHGASRCAARHEHHSVRQCAARATGGDRARLNLLASSAIFHCPRSRRVYAVA